MVSQGRGRSRSRRASPPCPTCSNPAISSSSTRRPRCPPPSTPCSPTVERIVLHVSTELPGGLWMVEPRRRSPVVRPRRCDSTHDADRCRPRRRDDRRTCSGRAPASHRLWLATVADGTRRATPNSRAHGRPIRYATSSGTGRSTRTRRCSPTEPGSAEMPSAARPFTAEIVTRLVGRGVGVAPITLHTGVSSLEGHELPYPERYRVPPATAALVNAVHAAGGTGHRRRHDRRAGARDRDRRRGHRAPGGGWTESSITPERGVRAVDGLLTGWHEPEATHLAMLEAVAGRAALVAAYAAAFAVGLSVARVRRQPPVAALPPMTARRARGAPRRA